MLEDKIDSIKSVGKKAGFYVAAAALAIGAIAYSGCGETACCKEAKCYELNMMCDSNPPVNNGYSCVKTSETTEDCCACKDRPSKI